MITAQTILSFERTARREGSGISIDDLLGTWLLQQTWTPKGSSPTPGTVLLLRGLNARLQLTRRDQDLEIINSVSVGTLQLSFGGKAELQGERPLLVFSFAHVCLKLGPWTLLKRSIPTPTKQRMPFFALIAKADDGSWLSARGRGGGLALWVKTGNYDNNAQK